MEFVALVTLLVLLQYVVFTLMVGKARIATGLKAPATAGNEIFERYYRVQQNTLEQLVVFLPSLFLFAQFVDARAAAILGSLFFIGRTLYAINYVSNPAKRGVGFIIGFLSSLILLIGAMVGVITSFI